MTKSQVCSPRGRFLIRGDPEPTTKQLKAGLIPGIQQGVRPPVTASTRCECSKIISKGKLAGRQARPVVCLGYGWPCTITSNRQGMARATYLRGSEALFCQRFSSKQKTGLPTIMIMLISTQAIAPHSKLLLNPWLSHLP